MGDQDMTDEQVWKRRFFMLMLARLSGTLLVLLGLLVGFSDVFFAGGSRPIGLVLALAGLIDLALLPKLLSRRWREP